jgi:hypothetical protein
MNRPLRRAISFCLLHASTELTIQITNTHLDRSFYFETLKLCNLETCLFTLS